MNLIKLLNLIKNAKFFFSNPKKNNLLIFDDTSIEDFENVLKDRKYYVLKTRLDQMTEIFITFKIIFYMIRYIDKNLAISYFIAIIKTTNTKIVLTTIDNCNRFHKIAKILTHDNINFIAVQNAARNDFKRNDLLFSRKLVKFNSNNLFFIPNYYCFGDEEEKDCRRFNININKFYKYGSLRCSNYLEYFKKNKTSVEKNYYDISFISSYNTKLDTLWSQEGISETFSILPKLVIKYCIKHKLKFLFIPKRNEESNHYEINFYKKYLSTNEFDYLLKNCMPRNEKKFPSYEAIHRSNLVIGSISTMLREKLALRGKILACNFTDLDFYDFPQKGICFLKKPSYEKFEERVTNILKMKIDEYFTKCDNIKLINTNSNKLTFNYINDHIDKLLKTR